MSATLYSLEPSHPSQAARLMLEHKGIEAKVVNFLPGTHSVMLRAHGFRGGTVPALRLDGTRVQGSRAISAFLEKHKPEPRLFPADRDRRIAVEEAERWGDEALQPLPRQLFRWVAVSQPDFRVELSREYGVPAPRLAGILNKPVAAFHAHAVGADDGERMRRAVATIPALLDHVDELVGEGTIGGGEPNAADFQIGTTVRVMMTWEDLSPAIKGRPAAALATSLMPGYPNHVAAGRLPAEWLEPLRA